MNDMRLHDIFIGIGTFLTAVFTTIDFPDFTWDNIMGSVTFSLTSVYTIQRIYLNYKKSKEDEENNQ